ncbi:MAG TPA: GNAT family N-acetyltransferase [Rhizomicrobium sp.]|nr:GNAT family N-acetyltransferase [Rhizomicrobium sp.]
MRRADIEPVTPADKPALVAELQDYIEEMTAYVDIAKVGGAYEYPGLDLYWSDEGRSLFWALADARRAGFAMLRRREDGAMVMGEFYVRPSFRRTGLGTSFARQLLERFPGVWILSEFATNAGAIAFWRRVIQGYAYTERSYVGGQGKDRLEQRVEVV